MCRWRPNGFCPHHIFRGLDTEKHRTTLECTISYNKFGCWPQLSEGTAITCSSVVNMLNKCSHA
jgi:hypothetical protein